MRLRSASTAPTSARDRILSAYLTTLQELRLVERRIPVTVAPQKQHSSKQGRYHLSDPFHRFYFRFLQPNESEVSYQPDRVLALIQQDLRAFVGATAWEELARQWVVHQARQNGLDFTPERVDSHWSRGVQTDVVAISWKERAILIGECKWGAEAVDRATVRDLLERTIPQVLADLLEKGAGWRTVPVIFASAGVTSAGQTELATRGGIAVNVTQLGADLALSP